MGSLKGLVEGSLKGFFERVRSECSLKQSFGGKGSTRIALSCVLMVL